MPIPDLLALQYACMNVSHYNTIVYIFNADLFMVMDDRNVF